MSWDSIALTGCLCCPDKPARTQLCLVRCFCQGCLLPDMCVSSDPCCTAMCCNERHYTETDDAAMTCAALQCVAMNGPTLKQMMLQ